VKESDVNLAHEAERISGRPLEKSAEVTDEMAVRLIETVAEASRSTTMKLMRSTGNGSAGTRDGGRMSKVGLGR
jgi:hypothetical protein